MSYCIANSNGKSICSIWSDDESGDEYDDSNRSYNTATNFLDQLRSSPSKARLRARRPWALKGLQKPLCRQQQPVKIRLNQDESGKGRAVMLLDKKINNLVRVPLRLHEQF